MVRASAGVAAASVIAAAGLVSAHGGAIAGVPAAGSLVEKQVARDGGGAASGSALTAAGGVQALDPRSAGTHACVHGPYGLTWTPVHQYSGYASITATEPHAAQMYRGTIRLLPHSRFWFISVSTWGQARTKIGDFHPYAVVYWPNHSPVWLILINSPALRAGSAAKVPCQR